jgi:hypothetical protein
MLHPWQSIDCLRERDTPIILGSGAPNVLGKRWIVNDQTRKQILDLKRFEGRGQGQVIRAKPSGVVVNRSG